MVFDDFLSDINHWITSDLPDSEVFSPNNISLNTENDVFQTDNFEDYFTDPPEDYDLDIDLNPVNEDVYYEPTYDNPDDIYYEPIYDVPDNNWCPEDFDGWGNPIEDAECWQQQENSASCAVVAQISVYESITGVDLCESDACAIAEYNGWFDPTAGTTPDDVGKLLEQLGIPTSQSYDATLDDITTALERGDKVIVGLDANEIWFPQRDPVTGELIEQPEAGHAVWVTGIDPQPDGSIKIILNDSGTPDGQMSVIDSEDFLNAWSDFSNFLVVADAPDSNQAIW